MSTHDKDNTIAFLEKVKKQAKKLLKLAKENNLKVEINNLSDALTLIAKINGYPDWHALSSNLNNILKKEDQEGFVVGSSNLLNEEKITLPKLNGFHAFESETHLTSFFELSSFPFDSYDEAESWISSFKEKLSFKWNMGFHDIKILFDFFNQEETFGETFSLFDWSEILGLTKEDFDELFSINLKAQPRGFCLKIVCAINTIKDQAEEHTSLCKEFRKDFFNKEWISKTEFSLLNFEENKLAINDESSPFYNLSLEKLVSIPGNSKLGAENLNWLHGIQTLYQKKVPIKLVAHISNDDTTLDILQSKSLDNKFLNGLWTSLNKKVYTAYSNFDSDNFIHLTSSESQASVPWSGGIPFINKINGNTIKIKLNTAYQTSFNNFIYAPPGSGKSSLTNVLNIDTILQQSSHFKGELPFVGVVDIGPASSGMIDLLKNSLPADKKDQVLYYKLTENDIINPFDTELGSRQPNDMHIQFLVDFITLLTSKENRIEEGVEGIIHAVIPLLYNQFSDSKNPKRYDYGVNAEVDNAIKKINFEPNHKTSWWNIVDVLFENDYIEEAKKAQSYAVPILSDFLSVFHDHDLRDIYGRVTASTGETLIQFLSRSISEAIRTIPSLTSPTKLNFKNAKIISLNLDNVARIAGLASRHKTAIYYLLASFSLAKHMNIYSKATVSELYDVPTIYHTYYKNKREEYYNRFSSLSFDEVHRVSSFDSVMNVFINYFRNSRKYGQSYTFISQSLENTKSLLDVSSNIFIFTSSLNGDDNKKVIELLNLRDINVISSLKNRKNHQFGDILYKSITNQGTIEKIISFKINPYVLWMISTTIEDCKVRVALIEKLGYFEAIKFLAKKYPYGVKKLFEQFRENNSEITMEEMTEKILREI